MGKDAPLAANPPSGQNNGGGAKAGGILFRTRECALFLELYQGLQRSTGELVPPRKSFDPAAARALLPYVSIMEIREPRLALVRLVGTAIVNRTHIDNTGRNMLDLLPDEAREWSWSHFRRLLDTPCGCTFVSREDFEFASVFVEIVSFPMADTDGTRRFVLSLSVEVDRDGLVLRGDQAMQIGGLSAYRYIDIGAGTGAGA